jgi:hypothetical protein
MKSLAKSEDNNSSSSRADDDLHTFSDASFASTFGEMKSVAGSVILYRSMPIAWRSRAISIRCYSTSEAEYAAAAETLKFSFGTNELRNFLVGHDCAPGPVWVDNRTALITARTAQNDIGDVKPKSRHYALRYLMVKDNAERLLFCPTAEMRADGLTKFVNKPTLRKLCGGVAFVTLIRMA